MTSNDNFKFLIGFIGAYVESPDFIETFDANAAVVTFRRKVRNSSTSHVPVISLLIRCIDGKIDIMVENLVSFSGTCFGGHLEAIDRCHKLLRKIHQETSIVVPF